MVHMIEAAPETSGWSATACIFLRLLRIEVSQG